MSTNDPQQQQMIREAMKAIAERRPGRTKLVYDKTKRTIVAVTEGTQVPRALNITADDADMFAVITLSTRWFRDHWQEIKRDGSIVVSLSTWDDGDALTQSNLGVQPSQDVERGTVLLGDKVSSAERVNIVLTLTKNEQQRTSVFSAPDGSLYHATCHRMIDGDTEVIDVSFADVQPELARRRSGILESTVLQDKTV